MSGNGSFSSTSNVTLYLSHVTLRTMANSQLGALNEQIVGGCALDDVAADTFFPGTAGQQCPFILPYHRGSPCPTRTTTRCRWRTAFSPRAGTASGLWGADHLKVLDAVIARDNIGVELAGGQESLTNVHFIATSQNVIGGESSAISALYASGIEVADQPTGTPFAYPGSFDFSEVSSGEPARIGLGSGYHHFVHRAAHVELLLPQRLWAPPPRGPITRSPAVGSCRT